MKHNCRLKDEDGEVYEQFLDAVIDGSVEYDDFYDAYLWHRPLWRKRFFRWLPNKMTLCLDILVYCPYCGEKLSDPIGCKVK